jgi:hypothetical protein
VAISGGYDISGAKETGVAKVIADVVLPSGPISVPGSVFIEAWEQDATAENWGVDAIAICAKVAP